MCLLLLTLNEPLLDFSHLFIRQHGLGAEPKVLLMGSPDAFTN